MRRKAKSMKVSLGRTPLFNSKQAGMFFLWFCKFIVAYTDNDLSEGMGIYLFSNLLAGEAETRSLAHFLSWTSGLRGDLSRLSPRFPRGSFRPTQSLTVLGSRRKISVRKRSRSTRTWTPSLPTYGAFQTLATTCTPGE